MDGIEEIIGILVLALLGSAGKLFGSKNNKKNKRKGGVLPETAPQQDSVQETADTVLEDGIAGREFLPGNGGIPEQAVFIAPAVESEQGEEAERACPFSGEKEPIRGSGEAEGNSRPDSDGFSLREAVIAKTLLDRKYF